MNTSVTAVRTAPTISLSQVTGREDEREQAVLVPIALARTAHVRPHASCHLARAVDWPRPGCPDGGHAGVHRSRPRRLGSRANRWTIWPMTFQPIASISWRRSLTYAEQGRGDRSRGFRRRSKGSRPISGQSREPTGTASRPVVVASESATGFSGFSWLGPIVGPWGPPQPRSGPACPRRASWIPRPWRGPGCSWTAGKSALAEAGDFLIPRGEGKIADSHIAGELGRCSCAGVPGRRTPEEDDRSSSPWAWPWRTWPRRGRCTPGRWPRVPGTWVELGGERLPNP